LEPALRSSRIDNAVVNISNIYARKNKADFMQAHTLAPMTFPATALAAASLQSFGAQKQSRKQRLAQLKTSNQASHRWVQPMASTGKTPGAAGK